MRKGIGPQMNADKRRCFGRMSAFLCLLTPIAVLAWNGTSRIRFGEIAARAKVQPTHHTRRFGGKNGGDHHDGRRHSHRRRLHIRGRN